VIPMLKRLVRHLFATQSSGRKAFPCATLQAIKEVIADGERVHRAEVKLIIEPGLAISDIIERRSSRDRAHDLFSQYRIWDTEENSGVLIYINLADHRVEIIADRGIACCVPPSAWQSICHTMTEGFTKEQYHESAITGLRRLNEILQQVFPESQKISHPSPNQLSDAPILL